MSADESVLDDPAVLSAGGTAEMLAAVATAGPQVREAATLAGEAGLDGLAEEGRPRALLVAGMGGSAIAGDVLLAVAGSTSPVPISVHRERSLPAWVGVADLVVAVSCSGATAETLSAVDEAVRRRVRLVCVGAAGSPLAARAEQAGAPFVAVRERVAPRATLWALATPLLVVADRLGLAAVPAATLESTAARLEHVASTCRPDSELFVNPAKALAAQLAGTLPVVWGDDELSGVAARRFVAQLAENAKYPAIAGVLPEAAHNQIVTVDGPLGRAGARSLFHDPEQDGPGQLGLRLLLLRAREDAGLAEAVAAVAAAHGLRVDELVAAGTTPLERLASLVGLLDYASVYLAVLNEVDPVPIEPIRELKAALA